MTDARHARVKALFHATVDRPVEEQTVFLSAECGDDVELLREVLAMLDADSSASDFLEEGAFAQDQWLREPLPPEVSQIGDYRIVQVLGAGAMGTVYEAEQDRPRRRVALKLLHAGIDTPAMRRRFELESEVLGRLDHPGIAHIFEAGISDSGRGPQRWFAMEFIRGEPLAEACRVRGFDLEAKLELIADLCDAVHHAHQRGIVHRDLKPANVFVDGSGQPKVLDFGSARVTDTEFRFATLQAHSKMIVGTLQYMSPEQARGDADAIDVRTDIWSIGVMLYEILAGRAPIDVSGCSVPEAIRRVLEVEAPALRKVAPRMPTDVAIITHKALEKEKERRYESAAALAADLRRYLRREPILAQTPTSWYRVRRFAARHRGLVGGVVATLAALVVGFVVALWQRDEARDALARAEGINRFLLSDLLASPSPEKLGRDVRVVDVLGPAARSAEQRFAGQPRVAAEVLGAVGASYRALGLFADGELQTRRGLALLGDRQDDRLALKLRGQLIELWIDLDRAAEAVDASAALLEDSRRTLAADDPDRLGHRAVHAHVLWFSGDFAAAIDELRSVTAGLQDALGEDDPRSLAAASDLAQRLAEHGGMHEARDLLSRTIAAQDRVLGPGHPATLSSRSILAWMLTMSSAWRDAEAIYDELLPAIGSAYGREHPYTAYVRLDAAQCPLHLGRVAEAAKSVQAASEQIERQLGEGHAWALKARLVLAEALFRDGQYPAAIAEADAVVTRLRASGRRSEDLGHALIKLGRCYQEADDPRAIATFQEGAEVYREVFGKPTDFLAQALYNLSVVTRDLADPQDAIAPLREALQIDLEIWGPEHRHVASDRHILAQLLLETDHAGEALTEIRLALAAADAAGIEAHRRLGYELVLGLALLDLGEAAGGDASGDTCAAAERHLRAVLDGLTELGRGQHRDAREAKARLLRLYEQQGRGEEAARLRDR